MQKACYVALFCILTFTSNGQQTEFHLVSTSDSVSLKWIKKAEAKTAYLDSISPNSISKTDSIRKRLLTGEKAIFSLNDNAFQGIDSLKPDLSRYNHKMDSLKGKLSRRIDSLQNLNLPTETYSQMLDSLNNKGPVKDLKEAESKLAALQTKMNEFYSKTSQSVSSVNNPYGARVRHLDLARRLWRVPVRCFQCKLIPS